MKKQITKFILFSLLLIIGLASRSFAQDKVAVISVNNSILSSDVNVYKEFYPCPERCNFIKNGEFECLSPDIFIGSNDVAPFYYNRVYGWQSGWGNPSITTANGMAYNNSTYLKAEWNNGVNTSAGIYQNITTALVPNVEYELTYSYKKPVNDVYNSNTTLHISLANFTPNIPDSATKPTFTGNVVAIDSSLIGYDGGNWHDIGPITFIYNDTAIKKLVIYPEVVNMGNTSITNGDLLIDKVVIKPKVKFNYPDITNICLGQTITITDTVPTVAIVSRLWTSSIGFSSYTKSITVSPTVPAIYTLTAYDANGCKYTGSIKVNVNQATPVTFNLQSPFTACSGQSVTIVASVSGATTSNCQWSSNPTANAGLYSNSPSITVTPLVSTTYTVTTDVNGCQTTGSFYVYIIPVQFNVSNPYILCVGSSVTINASVAGSTTSNCVWTSNPSGSYGDSTSITVSPTTTTSYTVVTNVGGCQTSGILLVNVVSPANLNLTTTWIDECKSLITFSFDTANPHVSYVWHIPQGTTMMTYSPTNVANINWNYTGPGTVSVDGYDIYTGCHVYKGNLYFDPNSCIPNAIQLSWLTSTQIINYFDSTTFVISNTNPIIFNGVTTVDKNIVFANCPNIRFGTNASMNVKPGKSLEFINCIIKQTCDCPWNGLFTEYLTSNIILTNDTIRDAKNAVVSSNGGLYQITSTNFVNDSVGLYVRNYNPQWLNKINGKQYAPPGHQGYVVGSSFTKNSVLPGFYSNAHLTGVILDTVYNIKIGDSTQINYYSHLQWGIKTRKSQVNIINNTFDSIYYTSLNSPSYNSSGEPNEAALFCKTEYATQVEPSMPLANIVSFDKSAVLHSNTGIYAYHTQMSITGSLFARITHIGIHLKDFDNPTLVVNNYAYQSTLLFDTIDNLYNYNIVAEQSNANAGVILDISYNYIGDPSGFTRSGILLRNCNGTLYGNKHCILQDNIITYSTITPATMYNYGISAFNCNYAKLFENTLQSTSLPDQSYHQKIFGLYLNAVQNAQVYNNQMIEMGDGIYVEGFSLGSQFYCNNFDKCWNGFYFDLVALSNQLIKHTASDNYWYDIPPISDTSAYRRLSGNSISSYNIKWYHRGVTNDINNIFSPYLLKPHTLYPYILAVQNIPVSTCHVVPQSKSLITLDTEDKTDITDDPLIANLTVRDQMMGDIVSEKIHYYDMQQENKYQAKEFAFKLMEESPAYMNLGTGDDNAYQSYYIAAKNSNSGSFYQIGKYINEKNYNAARDLNTSIVSTNTIESNRIAVNRIYLNKVINNQQLGTADSLTLAAIAYQSPLTGGDAVVSARVILGVDPIMKREVYHPKAIINLQDTETALTIKVYPNPANDKIYIMPDDLMDGMATVEIFDLTGKIVYNTTINAAIKLQSLNINTINKGIFNLRITANDKAYNQKLVIIK